MCTGPPPLVGREEAVLLRQPGGKSGRLFQRARSRSTIRGIVAEGPIFKSFLCKIEQGVGILHFPQETC